MPAQVIGVRLKPSRLNFAQLCIQCGRRWCTSPQCIGRHERSRWMVCPDCFGELYRAAGDPCGCLYGLVEICARPATAHRSRS